MSALNSVHAELIEDDGESRYKLNAVIGTEDGLGVENLRGSGMIAGETSQAYEEVVTFSLVTCRAVGIGAYLVRLGQRVCQVDNASIILTGAGALNKVSDGQLFGSILGTIQKSFLVVVDNLEGWGVGCVLKFGQNTKWGNQVWSKPEEGVQPFLVQNQRKIVCIQNT